MSLIEMFISFSNYILNFEILGFKLYFYLITFTVLIFIFNIIRILSNSNGSKQKKESKGSDTV